MSTPDAPAAGAAAEAPCGCIFCTIRRQISTHLSRNAANPNALVEVCFSLGFIQAELAAACPLEDADELISRVVAKGRAARAADITAPGGGRRCSGILH
jgi:hypothetical protein